MKAKAAKTKKTTVDTRTTAERMTAPSVSDVPRGTPPESAEVPATTPDAPPNAVESVRPAGGRAVEIARVYSVDQGTPDARIRVDFGGGITVVGRRSRYRVAIASNGSASWQTKPVSLEKAMYLATAWCKKLGV